MASKEFEITTNTYIFAGVGALISAAWALSVSAASPTRFRLALSALSPAAASACSSSNASYHCAIAADSKS